ncbi:hypothetical protein ACVWWR_004584 [Bradyrhizobium sp. LM3.2]
MNFERELLPHLVRTHHVHRSSRESVPRVPRAQRSSSTAPGTDRDCPPAPPAGLRPLSALAPRREAASTQSRKPNGPSAVGAGARAPSTCSDLSAHHKEAPCTAGSTLAVRSTSPRSIHAPYKLTGIEHLELRTDTEPAHARGHLAQYPVGFEHNILIPSSKAHCPTRERADLGTQLFHVHQPLQRAHQIGLRLHWKGELPPPSTRSPPMPAVRLMTGLKRDSESTSPPPIQRWTTRAPPGSTIAHMDVHHCSSSFLAPIAESSICSGLTGTCGLRSTPFSAVRKRAGDEHL